MTQRIMMTLMLIIMLILVVYIILATTSAVTNVTIVAILMVIILTVTSRIWCLGFSVSLVQNDVMQGIGEGAFVRQCLLAASKLDP